MVTKAIGVLLSLEAPNDWGKKHCWPFGSICKYKSLSEGYKEIIWLFESNQSLSVSSFAIESLVGQIVVTSLQKLSGGLK